MSEKPVIEERDDAPSLRIRSCTASSAFAGFVPPHEDEALVAILELEGTKAPKMPKAMGI